MASILEGDSFFVKQGDSVSAVSVDSILDATYNKAIDDAISKAKGGLEYFELLDDGRGRSIMNELIEQLEALKKKP